jgi:hypothetical protein
MVRVCGAVVATGGAADATCGSAGALQAARFAAKENASSVRLTDWYGVFMAPFLMVREGLEQTPLGDR